MPDDLRHPRCRRRVAAPRRSDDAVDDGHADAGQVAELQAVEDWLCTSDCYRREAGVVAKSFGGI